MFGTKMFGTKMFVRNFWMSVIDTSLLKEVLL